MKDQRYLIRILWVTGVLYELLLMIFLFMNFQGNIPLYMFVYFESFLLFFLGWYLVRQYRPHAFDETSTQSKVSEYFYGEKGKYYLLKIPLFILISGIIFRLTVVPSHPATSEDAFRYLWEGKMNLYGFNPYLISPDDTRLQDIYEDNLPSKANFLHMTSIYPPLSQYLFTAGYLISGDNTAGLKIIYLLCEIVTLIFLLKLVILKKKEPWLIILYAWLPLPVLEYFVNAHIDAAGIMFMILFIYSLEKDKIILSSLFFTFAVLIKLLPLMFLPLIFKRIGLQKSVIFTSAMILLSFLMYLPYLSDGIQLFNHLLKYLSRWEFNASVYNLLKLFLEGETARLICSILFGIVLIAVLIRQKDLIKGIMLTFLAYFIFTSTLYPWYLGWGAVLNPFFNFYSLMSILFTINLSNFTPLAEVWKEYTIVLLLEYIPFFVLLFYDMRRMRKKPTGSEA